MVTSANTWTNLICAAAIVHKKGAPKNGSFALSCAHRLEPLRVLQHPRFNLLLTCGRQPRVKMPKERDRFVRHNGYSLRITTETAARPAGDQRPGRILGLRQR